MKSYSHNILVIILTMRVVVGLYNGTVVKPYCPSLPLKCKELKSMYDTKYPYAKFEVNGETITVYITYENYRIIIACDNANITIDDLSMPRFNANLYTPLLKLLNCLPPKSSYANAVTQLNITPDVLQIYYSTKFDYYHNLTPEHFQRLSFLKAFFFTTEYLVSHYFDLDLLKNLSPNVSLALTGLVLPPFPSWNKFENVSIINGSPWKTSQTWGNCDYLRSLTLREYRVNVLPEGWLANCTRLEELKIGNLKDLKELPTQMLFNSISLRSLTITRCNIGVIPSDLFSYSKNLKFLDMSHNAIYQTQNLNASDFTSLTKLETLDLSDNRFSLYALRMLKPLRSLKYLNMEGNSIMGLCHDRGLKLIGSNIPDWPYLPSVVNLSLSNSAILEPCPEWREAMPSLKYLNISRSYNFFKKFYVEDSSWNWTFKDIKLIRESGWEVDARNTERDIVYNKDDYDRVISEEVDEKHESDAVLLLPTPLECNCNWYWFIKTLKERPNHISLPGFSCLQHWDEPKVKTLDEINPEYNMCAFKDNCPTDCECYRLAGNNSALVNCTKTKLNKVPRIDNLKELVIYNNHISTLQGEDLPDSLDYIDLRNNQLVVVASSVAKTMFSIPSRRIKLSNNPLLCHCENKAFFELLHLHKKQVLDFNNITCFDGFLKVLLSTVDFEALCSVKTTSTSYILLGCVIILVIISMAIYYIYRRKMNSSSAMFSFEPSGQDSDINKTYDAFISFSHEDNWFVTDELMPKLEEENGFKLCIHTRDWLAGDWIPAQIARSVQESRRTVIVLSKNFLSSIWALLEFRTAHIQALREKRSRVIIILLDELTLEMKMDVEIQAYLKSNTYLKWGEADFWKKLYKALKHRDDEEQIMKDGEKVINLLRTKDVNVLNRR